MAWTRVHRLRVIRRVKLIRHGLFAAVGVVMATVGFEVMRSMDTNVVIAAFALAIAGILVTIRESLGLINHLIGDTDFFEMRPQTWLDASVRKRVERFVTVRPKPASGDDAVKVLTGL